MKRFWAVILSGGLIAGLAAGCGNVNTMNSVAGDAAIYSADLSPARQIIVNKCASCHYHSNYAFKSDADWSVDTLIVPGDASTSTLYRRLQNNEFDSSRADMPLAAAPLSLNELETIRNWINNDL